MRNFIGLTFALVCIGAASAEVPADLSSRFVEIPGDMEFSGQMIARPIQPASWAARGVDAKQATENIAAARQAMTAYNVVEHVWQTDEYIFDVPAGQTEDQTAVALMSTGNFQYVHPNWVVFPLECPNDPSLRYQWHHDADHMQSCEGWDFHTGTPAVGVGICDTGIRYTHEEFLLNRREGYNAVDRVWERDGGPKIIEDLNGHGTSTTGCAAANGDNRRGISGVGWNLGHRMLRVSNSRSGTTTAAILNHAARTSIENGDRVASVSYTGVGIGTNRSSATYIKSIGGLMFWAAGNDNRNLNWGDRDKDDLIVVGGTDIKDKKASFSAFGPSVDLVAPAVNVLTTKNESDNSYRTVSGTSYACPLTAGLCALIWSYNSDLTPDEVEMYLKQGVDDLGEEGIDNIFGYGRINVFGSLSRVPVPCDPCDANCDGSVDLSDVEPFIELLVGGGKPCNDCTGDVNRDGSIDLTDVEGFIECLLG